MAERIAQIIVLAEDANQGSFARRYLIRAGHHKRTIRVRPYPSGKGSAEQYVREQYPMEVKYYRNRSSSRSAALVVAIDADVGTVVARDRQLESSLKSMGEQRRKPGEKITLLIPKRNIETWILCLSNEVVDETADYKGKADVHEKIAPAAETLFDWSRPNYAVPAHCVPSLRRGLVEVMRLG